MKFASPILASALVHALLASALTCNIALAAPTDLSAAPYLRFPAAQAEQLVFTAEGDLWRASMQGGLAQRLTTHASEESQAAISLDGKWLAFVASYDGPNEAYVMPMTGGLPQRVSFEGSGVQVLGWTAQGEIMYSVQAAIGPNLQRVVKLVNPSSLERRTLPLHDVTDASLDESGKTLYFSRLGVTMRQDNARRYRGGAMAQIWRYQLDEKHDATLLSSTEAADKRPMWWQGKLYFISDRDGSDNLWVMHQDGSNARQLTHERAWEVRNPSLGQSQGKGHITYQLGANLHQLDLATEKAKPIEIKLQSDFAQVRERLLPQALEYLSSFYLGASGEKVALTVRGKIVLAGLAPTRIVELATPAGSRARDAQLAPDGKSVYAIVDASGEQQIWRFALGQAEHAGVALTKDIGVYRTRFAISPDGKKLAHAGKQGELWLLDLVTGKNDVLQDLRGREVEEIVWAADSQALAITRQAEKRPVTQVWLYDLPSAHMQLVTSDKYAAHAPVFSRDGQWLYLLGERSFQATNPAPWGDRQMGPFFDKRSKIYGYALQTGLRFPFQPKNELDAGNAAPATPATSSNTKKPRIEFTGLAQRLFEVPAPAGNYRQLDTDGKRLYWLESEAGRENMQRATLKSIAIDAANPLVDSFASDISDYGISQDGKKIVLQKFSRTAPGELLLVDAGPRLGDISKASLHLKGWQLAISPAREWQQMFDDAWRMQRDFFFDKNMRGVNWQQVREKYRPLVAQVRDKYELNDLLAIMMAELGTLHSQIYKGDVRHSEEIRAQSYLGGVLQRQNDGYRIAHIYRQDAELPNERGPLAQHDFQVGDLITSINQRPLAKVDDIAQLLLNQAGQPVLIDYQRQGIAKAAVVQPINLERNGALRYGDWEWSRQQQVERASQGRIGYLHLRAMYPFDLNVFVREFYANVGRDGLIIDVRRNSGGNIDSWIIEKLLRRAWGFWQTRDGMLETHPQQSFRGHLVVLVDELTYSDGETFAAAIKSMGLGTVIGKRTSGAGVWLSDDNHLLDKGMARASENAQFLAKSGQWHIEGVGVEPDIKVENLPHASFQGVDAQLEAAIAHLQKQMQQAPVPTLRALPLPIKNQ